MLCEKLVFEERWGDNIRDGWMSQYLLTCTPLWLSVSPGHSGHVGSDPEKSFQQLLRSTKPGWSPWVACCGPCASISLPASLQTKSYCTRRRWGFDILTINRFQIFALLPNAPWAGAGCWEPGRALQWHLESSGFTQLWRISWHSSWQQRWQWLL